MYTNNCCGMIAMKREVAARNSGFSVERMSSQETDDKSLYKRNGLLKDIETTCENERGSVVFAQLTFRTHTGECTVTACRTYQLKVRKGGDFFYGKSGYENYTESL